MSLVEQEKITVYAIILLLLFLYSDLQFVLYHVRAYIVVRAKKCEIWCLEILLSLLLLITQGYLNISRSFP